MSSWKWWQYQSEEAEVCTEASRYRWIVWQEQVQVKSNEQKNKCKYKYRQTIQQLQVQLRYWIELKGSIPYINSATILGNSDHRGQCAQNWPTLSQSTEGKTTKVSTRTKNDSLMFCIWYVNEHIIMIPNQVPRLNCWRKWVEGSISIYVNIFLLDS